MMMVNGTALKWENLVTEILHQQNSSSDVPNTYLNHHRAIYLQWYFELLYETRGKETTERQDTAKWGKQTLSSLIIALSSHEEFWSIKSSFVMLMRQSPITPLIISLYYMVTSGNNKQQCLFMKGYRLAISTMAHYKTLQIKCSE